MPVPGVAAVVGVWTTVVVSVGMHSVCVGPQKVVVELRVWVGRVQVLVVGLGRIVGTYLWQREEVAVLVQEQAWVSRGGQVKQRGVLAVRG